jgi:hypothetical protein
MALPNVYLIYMLDHGLALFGRFPEATVSRTTTPDAPRIGYFGTLRSALVLTGARRMLLALLLSGALRGCRSSARAWPALLMEP